MNTETTPSNIGLRPVGPPIDASLGEMIQVEFNGESTENSGCLQQDGGQCPLAVLQQELPPKDGQLILVVDDDDIMRDFIRLMLNEFGYQVITASNGKEALAVYAARGHNIQAVITDLEMPVMNGLAMATTLKLFDPRVRIMVASGACGECAEKRLKALGIEIIVHKPFAIHEMLNSVEYLLKVGCA